MTGIADATQRARAIDPLHSFCVGAPAGSGKTELLIQRYLSLLARVERPEQVLAITFTRKAAAEMRERVLAALQGAVTGEPCEEAHEQHTRHLALAVLAQDEDREWQVTRDVSRLNIRTIDGFCAGLVRQMPVLSQLGGALSGQDDASELYAEAVLALFQHLDNGGAIARDLRALMAHLDNNWARLQELLVTMLARRDQWRDYVGVHHAAGEAEAYLVATVETVVTDELHRLTNLLLPYAPEMLEMLQFAAENLDAPVPADFPPAEPAALAQWRQLRHMVLTADGNWRKKVDKRNGFPAGKGRPEDYKTRMNALLGELRAVTGLDAALGMVSYLPEMGPGTESWRMAVHLSRLLPVLAAELLLVFQRRGVVDHTQVSQSALLALGDDDGPTDLALRLDYQIEHILIDEFQDTAITQYELLHKLTRGWGEYNAGNPGAPRTLMIVGDAMQSIYGFRGANVGLFLKAREEGFNGVALEYLQLASNFRSDAGVVNWVNQTFSPAFPDEDDVHRSRVSYSPAATVKPADFERPVETLGFCGEQARAEELAFVLQCIADCAGAEKVVAVLGRTRAQLQPILEGLQAENIAYNAQDLGSLARSPLAADLLTLCRALANDADRLAWMALLRAPWCGLTLADMSVLAEQGSPAKDTALWQIVQDAQDIAGLSDDGRKRMLRLLPPLHWARSKRDRLGLRALVETAWVALGGPECASDAVALEDAESFLQLLEQADAQGLGLDIAWLETQLDKQFMAGGDPDAKVQLMTLHKAKGLEFDHVIIPMLDRGTRGEDRDLLLWDEYSGIGEDRRFLLAADDHSDDGDPTLYNFLRHRRKEKRLLENTRLLYVGATRAVKKLWLSACVPVEDQAGKSRTPSRQSLLSPIWETFSDQMQLHHSPEQALESAGLVRHLSLHRLALGEQADDGAEQQEDMSPTGSVAGWSGNLRERSIGTVVHEALEELSLLPLLPHEPQEAQCQRWMNALRREGLHGDVLQESMESVLTAVRTTLSAEHRGRWLLSNEHDDPHSEWALTTVDEIGTLRDIVIDRCFIDRKTGVRWIVDYKNSVPLPGEVLDDFLAREAAEYKPQLTRYRHALQAQENNAVCCALFFTRLGHLHPLAELELAARETV